MSLYRVASKVGREWVEAESIEEAVGIARAYFAGSRADFEAELEDGEIPSEEVWQCWLSDCEPSEVLLCHDGRVLRAARDAAKGGA